MIPVKMDFLATSRRRRAAWLVSAMLAVACLLKAVDIRDLQIQQEMAIARLNAEQELVAQPPPRPPIVPEATAAPLHFAWDNLLNAITAALASAAKDRVDISVIAADPANGTVLLEGSAPGDESLHTLLGRLPADGLRDVRLQSSSSVNPGGAIQFRVQATWPPGGGTPEQRP